MIDPVAIKIPSNTGMTSAIVLTIVETVSRLKVSERGSQTLQQSDGNTDRQNLHAEQQRAPDLIEKQRLKIFYKHLTVKQCLTVQSGLYNAVQSEILRHAAGILRDLFCQRVERIGIQRFLHLFLQNLLIVHLRFLFAHFMCAIFFMLKAGFAASKRLYQRIQQLHQ